MQIEKFFFHLSTCGKFTSGNELSLDPSEISEGERERERTWGGGISWEVRSVWENNSASLHTLGGLILQS